MDRINLRQLIILTFIISISMKMFMLPALMTRALGRDSFIVMLIDAAAELILLFVVLLIMQRSEGENFFSLLSRHLGKVISRIIVGIFGLFYIAKLYMALTDIRIFFSNTVYNAPLSAFHLIPVILLVMYFAVLPLSSVGRVSELLIPWILGSMIILGFMVIPKIEFNGLFPILSDGWGGVLKGGQSFPLWFGDSALLLIFVGKAPKTKKVYFSLISGFVAFVILIAFASVLVASYSDMPEVLSYGQNISNMTQYAVESFNIGRFDLVVFSIWVTAVFVSAGIMLSFVTRSIDYIINRKIGRYSVIVLGIGMVVLFYIFDKQIEVIDFAIKYTGLPSAAVQYGLPIIILPFCLSGKKGRKKQDALTEKNNVRQNNSPIKSGGGGNET